MGRRGVEDPQVGGDPGTRALGPRPCHLGSSFSAGKTGKAGVVTSPRRGPRLQAVPALSMPMVQTVCPCFFVIRA